MKKRRGNAQGVRKGKLPCSTVVAGERSALLAQIADLQRELQTAVEHADEQRKSIRQVEALREYYINSFDFAAVGVANLTRDGVVLDINLCGAELMGYSREELLQRPLLPLFVPEDRRKWIAHLSAMREQTRENLELRVPQRSGETVVLRFYSLRMPHDSPKGFATIRTAMIDVTAQRAAEEALREAKKVAETANRAKDQFLALLSHELRTPLTPVLTTLAMLERDRRFPAVLREHAEMIRRNVELEARLIDDLLDVTRITRGKLELAKRPLVIGEIIHQAAEVCETERLDKRLQVVMKLGAAGESVVEGDEARLQQVFWNLLKNAVKFTPEGGRIEVRCSLEREHWICVEVKDTGAGIDPRHLRKIFEPFEQAGEETTKRYGGLGLGLAICRGIVEKHGGSISAQSEGPGQGASFSVLLPVCQGSPQRSSALLWRSGAAGPRPVGNSLRILLVEDHADTAKVMAQLLTMSGHVVETAMSVGAALEAAARCAFDMVISDLGLPDGSGLDLIRELRVRGCTAPAIALSGYGQEDDVQRCVDAGFAVHMTKPADPDRLLKTVDVVANRSGPASAETSPQGQTGGPAVDLPPQQPI